MATSRCTGHRATSFGSSPMRQPLLPMPLSSWRRQTPATTRPSSRSWPKSGRLGISRRDCPTRTPLASSTTTSGSSSSRSPPIPSDGARIVHGTGSANASRSPSSTPDRHCSTAGVSVAARRRTVAQARWLTALVTTSAPIASPPVDHAGRERLLLMLMLAVGGPAALVAGVFIGWGYAPVVGWSAAALTFCLVTWAHIRHRDADQTAAMASRDDPSPTTTDLLLLMANVASLAAVAYVL